MGANKKLVEAIEDDFKRRHPLFHKSRREALTTLTGVMLDVRSANLMELAEGLPREIGAAEHLLLAPLIGKISRKRGGLPQLEK